MPPGLGLGLDIVLVPSIIATAYYLHGPVPNHLNPKYRLLNPLFAEVEARLGVRVPEQIVQLYRDQQTILQTDFYVLDPVQDHAAWLITQFLPVDALTIAQKWPRLRKCFVFAATRFGHYYFVPMDLPDPKPLPVFVLHSEKREVIKVAEAIEDFLVWPRIQARLYHQSLLGRENQIGPTRLPAGLN